MMHGGWLLGVVFVAAFIHLGHEQQDLWSPCGGNACVHRLDLSLYSHQKAWGIESEPMLIPRENPLYQRLRRESNLWRFITLDSKPNTIPTELSGPEFLYTNNSESMKQTLILSYQRFLNYLLQSTSDLLTLTHFHPQFTSKFTRSEYFAHAVCKSLILINIYVRGANSLKTWLARWANQF